jgi:hypothetical protein
METEQLEVITQKMIGNDNPKLLKALNKNFKTLQNQNIHLIGKVDGIEKDIKEILKILGKKRTRK